MNAVEIEEAVSQLAESPFDSDEFPFAFLEAFGNKKTTIKKLKSKRGGSNKSDLDGVLQRNNIHLKVCPEGEVTDTLTALRESLATTKQKAKFILATDGHDLQAENLVDGETIACDYPDFHDHFGFFLALAGITTVRQIRENAFDIKATSRLNKLYVELLKTNPDWDTAERRQEMNHFMARLIFCFFAEDTNIFHSDGLFTQTVAQMSASDASNTHEVLAEVFRAMSTRLKEREAVNIRNWADQFPYANGGLFSGSVAVPRFSRIARAYLLQVGNLDWTKINPDIFGSMIQAVADDDERGALGMHYTSVPNILKVLNPLFLDDLRAQLEAAGDNPRKLLNLRKRMARIRVFDPACGSGNFLVIAYKQMREIEAEINQRREEPDLKSEIPLTNFRGIEIRHFSCEVARLALAEFLPLKDDNWITCGNALRLDWLSICPPTGTGVKLVEDDLFSTPLEQTEIDFENEGGETYICGNPPYVGFTWQSKEQKSDIETIFSERTRAWKSLDYVAGWFMKAADYGTLTNAAAAFVSTNSICQGEQVPIFRPLIFEPKHEIAFAHTSFKWANLASHNAGVTVVVVGIARNIKSERCLFQETDDSQVVEARVANINAYLVPAPNISLSPVRQTPPDRASMVWGNKPTCGGNLVLTTQEKIELIGDHQDASRFIKVYLGAAEFIRGLQRYCIWVTDDEIEAAENIPELNNRFEGVRAFRLASKAAETRRAAEENHRFRQIQAVAKEHTLIMPQVSSERREYLPVGLLPKNTIVSNLAFALYDAPLWNMALIASRLHLVWIATVCGKLETRYRYSNTLGWNTFPVPTLTAQNKADLTRCAEDILLAREHYFPATIADMYDPDRMDSEFPLVRAAHNRNDEVLERIYIGRHFKNDTERLEKLFDLYTKMTAPPPSEKTSAKRRT